MDAEAGAGITVVVVHFNAAEYLGPCVASLRAQESADLAVEVIVVENASTLDPSAALAEAKSLGARVLCSARNDGYAAGANRGIAAASFPVIAVLNADVLALPGVLRTCVAELARRPRPTIVEPRTYLDVERRFLQPAFLPTRLLGLWRELRAERSARVARTLSEARLRHSLRVWRAQEPILLEGLGGPFLVAHANTWRELRGFDAGYELYHEDFDLFLRARRAGVDLVHLPRAEAVHFGHRSAITVWGEAMEKFQRSRVRYVDRHLGWPGRAILRHAARRGPGPQLPAPTCRDLGVREDPPELPGSEEDRVTALLLSADPHFLVAAGCFLEADGGARSFPAAMWYGLPPVPLYLRAVDLARRQVVASWRVHKSGAARVAYCTQKERAG